MMSSRYPQLSRIPLVSNCQRSLTGEGDATLLQLEAQTFLVGRLQKPGSEFTMNANCKTDDVIGQGVSRRIVLHSSLCSLCLCGATAGLGVMPRHLSLALRGGPSSAEPPHRKLQQ